MNRNPRVLVMGAAGQVGGALIRHLKNIPSIEIVAAARNVSKASTLEVPVVHLDLDDTQTFAPALSNVERLFMATAGAEPAYMKCVFDSYTDFTNGVGEKADEVFDNFPALAGRKPRLLSDFVREHADQFRY